MSSEEQDAKSIAQKSLRNFEIHRSNCLCEYYIKPVLFMLSIPYTILLLGFIICFVVGKASPISHSTNWVIFIVIGIILICLVNICVLLVGRVWLISLKLLCCLHKGNIKCY